MTERAFWLHIGLPKTATTHLQAYVFPRLPDVDYLGKFVGTDRERSAELIRPLAKFLHGAKRDSASVVESLVARDRAPTMLLCSAGIGVRFTPRLDDAGRHLPAMPFTELSERIEQLSTGLPFRLGVMLSVRDQATWLASQYANEAKRTRRASQRGFEAFVDAVIAAPRDGTLVLDYDLAWQALASAVGEGSVAMVPYETLSADPAGYAATCARALRTDEQAFAAGIGRTRAHVGRADSGDDERPRWELRARKARRMPGTRRTPIRQNIAGGAVSKARRGRHIELTAELAERIEARFSPANDGLAAILDRTGQASGWNAV